ncbi:UDP-2,3-diacylglucosamine diphosphatase [Carboxylicivirga mesophila]|uniref:UDP-2,3-diacylglucosamine diphosphatase n=1 Tax=Carboxylicivirga mesophila TaxID=1166478 RepID=A0ABS5K6F4_9BACT|nr:UDP-2,3-diacylglucosamine diphosphatase [Carboxylicivirga mesophila]MBS2210492.1 UDP-2,3-diacylglucosamine diphosphatase [Carboxylicivirga mesophila]
MNNEKQKKPRHADAIVLSDTHLGTFGCKAEAIVSYLNSISTPILILNGDIIDIWQFSKSYFPKSHLKVIRQLLKMMEKGTHIYYITGNHDEHLRRLAGQKIGNLSIVNKLILELDGKKSWIFHGDVFDVFMHHSKWLAKLGATGYGILTLINRFTNAVLPLLKLKKVSLSRDVKKSIKKGKNNITSSFERTVSNLAIQKGYDYAICGHIHWPEKKNISNEQGSVCYLNSGDWVENMTALEYYNNDWHLHYYEMPKNNTKQTDNELVSDDMLLPNHKILFQTMVNDIINS